jgi:hypothetical protein
LPYFDLPDTAAGLKPGGPSNNGGPTLTIALTTGSHAIGAVHIATLCSTPDQRGVTRSTPCDIGAFETVHITLTPATLPAATWEAPYGPVTFGATGGTGPYTFSVPPGALPTGLTLSSGGVLNGTPTDKAQIGTTFTFTVTATDSSSFTGTQEYSIKVVSPCGAGLTPYFLSAASHTGNFTGIFCVNGSGTGTYVQSGGAHGTGTVTTAAGSTRITAFGTDLALVGEVNAWSSTFTETAPAPQKAGTFTLL